MEAIIFKHKNRIVCYIKELASGGYTLNTGKPSDASCISWKYKDLYTATQYAKEYLQRSIDMFKSI